jgi:hypothetical protein
VVVQPDGLSKYQTVETGPIEEGLRVITKGLSGDETVIVEGIGKVRPNIKVNAQPVEMTKYASEELAIETHINAGSPDVASGASDNRAKSGSAGNDKSRLSAERPKPEGNGKNE